MCLILQSAASWGMHFSWWMTEVQEEPGRNLQCLSISAQNTFMIASAHFPLARASHMAKLKVSGTEEHNLPHEATAQ